MLGRKQAQEVTKPAPAKAPQKGSKTSPSTSKEFSRTPVSISIEEHAYYLWEKEGKPEGRDLEIWLRAEKEFISIIIKE